VAFSTPPMRRTGNLTSHKVFARSLRFPVAAPRRISASACSPISSTWILTLQRA
jgi:hypothetical protein